MEIEKPTLCAKCGGVKDPGHGHHCRPPPYFPPRFGEWIPLDTPPAEAASVLICGYGSRGYFVADAVYDGAEYLMFDQVTDRHCFPCLWPTHWMPLPPEPEM